MSLRDSALRRGNALIFVQPASQNAQGYEIPASHLAARFVRLVVNEPALSQLQCLYRLGLDPDDPFVDDHLDALQAALKTWVGVRSGWVYVVRTKHHTGSLHKIGMTRKDPATRVRSLDSAGVVEKVELVGAWPCRDALTFERQIHQDLGAFRYRKEFFEGWKTDALLDVLKNKIAAFNAVIDERLMDAPSIEQKESTLHVPTKEDALNTG